jgi:hypothetical protein
MMLRSILVAGVSIVVAGCAGSSKTYGPDGSEMYSLNCSGWARNWGMCLEKAGELCGPRGYQIVNQSGDRPGTLVTGSSSGTSSGMSAAPVISRTMLVKCGRE